MTFNDIMPSSEEALAALAKITKIESDNDWDGVAAAIIAQSEIHERWGRIVPVNLSGAKVVQSDSTTLILDKTTDGNGVVVDHHRSSVVAKNYLSFNEDGTIPASSLMYRMLPKEDKSLDRLLLAATGEIMDGFYDRGARDGAVREAIERMPWLAAPSLHPNQYLRPQEICSIADVLALLPTISLQKSFEVGSKLVAEKIRTSEDVISLCDEELRTSVKKYFEFMDNFPYDRFRRAKIGDFDVRVAREDELEFPMPALGRILVEKPGNYIVFKPDGLSIRTNKEELVDKIVKRLGDDVASYGGRAGAYGVQFKERITYEQFEKAVIRTPVKVI